METQQNIVFYSGHCEIVGGDAKYLFDLVNSLDAQKYSTVIYTDINPVFERRAQQWLTADIKIQYIDTKPALFRPSAGYESINRLQRWASLEWLRGMIHNAMTFYHLFKNRKQSIDIFHVNNGGYPGKPACLIAVLMAKLMGLPHIILSVHSMPMPRKWFHFKARLTDFFVERACDEIILASKILQEKMVEYRQFRGKNLHTIYCGLEDRIPLNQEEVNAKKDELKIRRNIPLAIICGNIDEDRKGHFVLLKAIAMLKSRYPDILLLVVGEGTSERKIMFDGFVKKLEIVDNVRFLGYRLDIHELNCISDFAVVPSLCEEATPYTIKEAARAGKPSITTWAGGCAEAVEPNVTGLLIPPGDVNSLVAAMDCLCANKTVAQTMGTNARKEFLQRFLLDCIVAEHENIYSTRSKDYFGR